MANSTSNLNLLKAQQTKKETVANNLFNAMSPAAFGGLNPDESNLLVWSVYGGGTVPNASLNLSASTTNYVYYDSTSKTFKVATSAPATGLLYTVITDSNTVTSYTDNRMFGSGSGGGTTLSLYKENGTPDAAPIATGNKSIAMGDGSQSTADYSFAAGYGAQSKAQSSFSLGQNNNVYMRMSAILAGSGNALNAGEYAVILGGQNNTIALNGSNGSILNSYSCNVLNYGYGCIINSNQSSINGSGTESGTIIGGVQSTIQSDASYSFVWGPGGRVVNPFTYQLSFSSGIFCQKSGLSTTTNSSSEQEINLGNNAANIHRFKIDVNTATSIKVSVLGFNSAGNAVKFSGTALIKRHNNYNGGMPTFAGTTDMSIALNKDISDTAFNACTSRIYIDGIDLKVVVAGIDSTNINWTAIIDVDVGCRIS